MSERPQPAELAAWLGQVPAEGMDHGPWSVFVPCRLWTLNEEIRQHWTWRQGVRKAVRVQARVQATIVLARRQPPEPPVRLVVTPQARRLNQDAGGCVTVAKPAVDGLVDAGALPADGPSVVVAITFEVAQRALRAADEGLVITILPAEL